MDTLNFTVNISILAREDETKQQTTARLNDVLEEALLGLADHHIDYTVFLLFSRVTSGRALTVCGC